MTWRSSLERLHLLPVGLPARDSLLRVNVKETILETSYFGTT